MSAMQEVKMTMEPWREHHARFEKAHPAGADLTRRRRAALARFLALGFPTKDVEAWRYTDPSVIAHTPFVPVGATEAGRVSASDVERFLFPDAKHLLVTVDGHFSPPLSRLDALPTGLVAKGLADVLANEPTLALSHVDESGNSDSAFQALAEAFLADGAFVSVADGVVVREPLHVLHVLSRRDAPAAAFPRTLARLGRSSGLTLVETFATLGGRTLTVAATTLVVGENATLDHVRVQREGAETHHVSSTTLRQARASTASTVNVALGAALARNDVLNVLEGEGANSTVDGLFLVNGNEHVDNHTLIDHAAPHCGSRELYKGIATGSGRGVFLGRIIVRPGAQKTDAKQTNKNLLLSDDALIDSTPQLEIYADDVKCTHGSTTGQLSADALFYLRSRGIGDREARALLVHAFVGDVLTRIKTPAIRETLDALVTRWLREAA